MSKFRDLFTENFDLHKLYNKNYLEKFIFLNKRKLKGF